MEATGPPLPTPTAPGQKPGLWSRKLDKLLRSLQTPAGDSAPGLPSGSPACPPTTEGAKGLLHTRPRSRRRKEDGGQRCREQDDPVPAALILKPAGHLLCAGHWAGPGNTPGYELLRARSSRLPARPAWPEPPQLFSRGTPTKSKSVSTVYLWGERNTKVTLKISLSRNQACFFFT